MHLQSEKQYETLFEHKFRMKQRQKKPFYPFSEKIFLKKGEGGTSANDILSHCQKQNLVFLMILVTFGQKQSDM